MLKLQVHPPGARPHGWSAELWLYPDGSRILELSTKCVPAEAIKRAVEARAYLGSRASTWTGEQQAKTPPALEFFQGSRIR